MCLTLPPQNSVEDDGEMFVETPDEIEPTALQKRRSEILRIREEEEAVLQSQEFDFCWNSTLGLKLRNGSVVNLHGYARARGEGSRAASH